MKKCLPIFCLLLSSLFATAQCDLPYGDFESWDDGTYILNDYFETTYEDHTVKFPATISTFFRLFDLSDELVLDLIANTSDDQIGEEVFGISRTEASRTGEYAFKLGGDVSLGYADFFSILGCESMESPEFISFYYKHVGPAEDTLFMSFYLGDNSTVFKEIDDPNLGAYGDTTLYASGDDALWNWVQIPITMTDTGVPLDTLVSLGATIGPADGDSYFIIDDVQWNIQTPVVDIENSFVFQLGQSKDASIIYPKLNHEHYDFKNYKCYDSSGRLVQSSDQWSDAIDVSELRDGHYYFQVNTDKGTYTKPFIRYIIYYRYIKQAFRSADLKAFFN